MLTDREKLLKTFDIFETAIKKIEEIGEYDDFDLDRKIDLIYDNLQNLSASVYGLLEQRNWHEEV